MFGYGYMQIFEYVDTKHDTDETITQKGNRYGNKEE